MRNLSIIILISGMLVFSSCQTALTQAANPSPTPSNNAHPDDGAPRISLADAKAAFDSGNAVFIDTRSEDAYKEEHIKGALNITLSDDASKYNTIPKGKKIIAYCS